METDCKLAEISPDCVIVVRIEVPEEPGELERCSADGTKVLEQRLFGPHGPWTLPDGHGSDDGMKREIRKAAVLGAGTMGSRIAAHLANAGIDCLLLDIPAEGGSPKARNAIVQKSLKALRKSRVPAFFTADVSKRLSVGNFDDDLARISEADWIIEAVVENFDIKRDLLQKVDQHRREGTLVTTNTSGLPVASLAEGLSDDFRRHWLGTHFFNPPRHMRLVEIIETPETDPEVSRFVSDFCDRRLGKVVVYANDRPNFIANRIFLFSVMHSLKTMLDQGLTVEQVDALSGPLIGRTRMATFRLADFTGIDVCLFVAGNLYGLVPDDEKREVYQPPEFLSQMVKKGIVGDKGGQGFYKRDKRVPGGRLVFDIESMDYREPRKPDWPILDEAKRIPSAGERIKFLVNSEGPVGDFLWETISELLLYTAARIPEITDDIAGVDTTMKSGFNWSLGIFEIWDQLGVEQTAERAKAAGKEIPPLVSDVLSSPGKSFYGEKGGARTYFDTNSSTRKTLTDALGTLRLSSVLRRGNVLRSNKGASLLDLGDGIVCLEFHSKANSLDADVFSMIGEAVAEVEAKHDGLVVANEGENFSVGANLMMLLGLSREGKWQEVDKAIEGVQQLFLSLRNCSKPTVAAVFSRTLAGGCELAIHCGRVQAAAESYMGLVEVGVGLIPAGGGCKELLRRHTELLSVTDDLVAATRNVFQLIGMAKVSNSAAEARQWRLLRPVDSITMNRDRLIADAKQTALSLAAANYEPAPRPEVLVGGKGVRATLQLGLYLMHEAARISDYDRLVGRKLANVLAGGGLSQPSWVSEEYMLNLEREAFLSLCGEEKTQQRMEHILKTGKPLRN